MLFNKNPDDVKRFLEMNDERKKLIDKTPATPLPSSYKVNELASILHPMVIEAEVVSITKNTKNISTIAFKSLSGNNKFPFFKAGQFVTVSLFIDGNYISRPYSIVSSPKEALGGIIKISVQKTGYFSDYLTSKLKVKDKVFISEPSGEFYYDNLRDKKTIVALAGGSGVTPFISMIKSLEEGSDDFELILLYGARKKEDLLIDYQDIKTDKVKLIIVLSDEKVNGYEYGFLSSDLIYEYLPKEYSIFMCGPNAMYSYAYLELEKLGINKHSVRREHNSITDLTIDNPKTFKIKLHIRDSIIEIDAKENETILTSIEKAGVTSLSRCRSGVCGLCHSRLLSGEYYVEKENDYRRKADHIFNYIHPCATYPLSDMEIEIPYVNLGGNE